MAAKWITKALFGKDSSSGDGSNGSGNGASGGDSNAPKHPNQVQAEAQAKAEAAAPQPTRNPDLDKTVVLLLYGKNSFGDQIYSYLKITIAGIEELKRAILVGKGFNPSDFGAIIAAGKGEPTDEVRMEISSMYQVLSAAEDNTKPEAVKVTQKKSWDDY